MQKSTAFKAACLGATLATAWSAGDAKAEDFQINATASLSQPVSDVKLLIGDQEYSIPNDSTGVSALADGDWAGTLQLSAPSNFEDSPWVMVGLGTGAMSSDVFVVTYGGTLYLNVPFEQAFPGVDEATLAKRISIDDDADVDKFMLSEESSALISGISGTLMMFSDGVDIGTATVSVTPVPEPSSLGFLAMAMGGLLRRFRSRR